MFPPSFVPTAAPVLTAPVLSFQQAVQLSLPGGCGSLGNDTKSQRAVAATTARAMQLPESLVVYQGCSNVTSRRRLASSASSAVSANTQVTVPLQLFPQFLTNSSASSSSVASQLLASLTTQLKQSVSSGNFTRTLKTVSLSLGATATAAANATKVGVTSAVTVMAPPTARPSPSPSVAPHGTSKSSSKSSLSGGAIAGIVIGSVAGLVLLVGAVYVLFLQCGGGGKPRRKSTPPGANGDMETGQGRVHPFISGPGMLSLTAQQTNDLDFGVAVPVPAVNNNFTSSSNIDHHQHSGSSDLSEIYPRVGDNEAFANNSPRGNAEEAVMMSSVALRPVSVDYVGI